MAIGKILIALIVAYLGFILLRKPGKRHPPNDFGIPANYGGRPDSSPVDLSNTMSPSVDAGDCSGGGSDGGSCGGD